MRFLPRLFAILAGFCFLGISPGVLAQDKGGEPAPHSIPSYTPPSLSELKIVRSSRDDTPDRITVETAEIPEEPTRVLDPRGAERLMRNEGVSLQWIGWEERGPVWVAVTQTDHWSLMAMQKGQSGGELKLEGFITEIGKDYFLYQGTIKIFGAPDEERFCNVTKPWRFEVTQNRSYYRLREFEWCDGLTDYIDIYFPPSMR